MAAIQTPTAADLRTWPPAPARGTAVMFPSPPIMAWPPGRSSAERPPTAGPCFHPGQTRQSSRMASAAESLFFGDQRLPGWLWPESHRRSCNGETVRSEEHTSELQSLMRTSYAVFCLQKNKQTNNKKHNNTTVKNQATTSDTN